MSDFVSLLTALFSFILKPFFFVLFYNCMLQVYLYTFTQQKNFSLGRHSFCILYQKKNIKLCNGDFAQ